MDGIIRGGNVYVQEINQRLHLDNFKLPSLKREMIDFFMGGGFFKVSLPGEVSPLVAEMAVDGSHQSLRSRFGREPGDWTTVTYYERLLDATSGINKGRIVMLRGLLNEIEPSGVEGLKAKDKTMIRFSSIVLYHDIVDGVTVHKFDVFNNTLVIDGTNYTAEHNRLIAA